MSIYMDFNNYNPRNINSSSHYIPEFESSEYNRNKYSFLCGSKAVWEQYTVAEQSCLAYSYNERVKVCRNTDKRFYIVQDFNNFQQHFLGVGARLVEKDRRLPTCSIP